MLTRRPEGRYRPLAPPAGPDRIDPELRQAGTVADAADTWKLSRCGRGHVEIAAICAEAMNSLDEHLE